MSCATSASSDRERRGIRSTGTRRASRRRRVRLAQGLGNAVGMALAERLLNARLGSDLVDHHTYCIAGDGCLMEGISHEAISLAGHLRLGKLIVLFDDNSISIDGSTSLAVSDDQVKRFEASGWNTARIDGHDPAAISSALKKAKADASKPWLIACKTIIGYGAPNKAGKASAHGEPLGAEEIKATRENLGWTAPPFEMPPHILDAWRALGKRHAATHKAWEARLQKADATAKNALGSPLAEASRAETFSKPSKQREMQFAGDAAKRATRVWSQMTLEHLTPVVAGAHRRIGGPHRLQWDKDKASYRDERAEFRAATICTTACASTAWRRR